MLQSRFDRTLYPDVDLLVLADLSDLFEVLDKFHIAATHDQYRNPALARRMYREPIANAFPQIDSGVLAFRKTEPGIEFLHDWKNEIKTHGIGKDQPSLRELLWKKDLKLAVLPPEYNLWDLSMVDCQEPRLHAAPRILHSSVFSGCPEPAPGMDALVHYLGKARAYKISLLLAADETLAQRAGRSAQFPTRQQRNRMRWLYAAARVAKLQKMLVRALKSPFQRAGPI